MNTLSWMMRLSVLLSSYVCILIFSRNEPTTSYEPSNYVGIYLTSLNIRNHTEKEFVDSCSIIGVQSAPALLHVKCPDVCGQPLHFQNNIHQKMRISGGKVATSGSHPWLVSLHLNGSFVCGGSIIEKKWVRIDSCYENHNSSYENNNSSSSSNNFSDFDSSSLLDSKK